MSNKVLLQNSDDYKIIIPGYLVALISDSIYDSAEIDYQLALNEIMGYLVMLLLIATTFSHFLSCETMCIYIYIPYLSV